MSAAAAPASSEVDADPTQKLLLGIVSKQLARQSEDFDRLDAKIGVVLGFALVALAQIVGAVLRIQVAPVALPSTLKAAMGSLFVLTLISITFVICFGITVIRIRKFHSVDVLEDIKKHPRDAPNVIAESVLLVAADVIQSNDEEIGRKADKAATAVYALAAAVGFIIILAAAFFFAALSGILPTSAPPSTVASPIAVQSLQSPQDTPLKGQSVAHTK